MSGALLSVKMSCGANTVPTVGGGLGQGSGQPPSTEFYFYQSADGQCVFLHPLVSRALLAHYGSYAACPPQVSSHSFFVLSWKSWNFSCMHAPGETTHRKQRMCFACALLHCMAPHKAADVFACALLHCKAPQTAPDVFALHGTPVLFWHEHDVEHEGMQPQP